MKNTLVSTFLDKSNNTKTLELKFIEYSSLSHAASEENKIRKETKVVAYIDNIKVMLLKQKSLDDALSKEVSCLYHFVGESIPRLLGYTLINNEEYYLIEYYELTLED